MAAQEALHGGNILTPQRHSDDQAGLGAGPDAQVPRARAGTDGVGDGLRVEPRGVGCGASLDSLGSLPGPPTKILWAGAGGTW